MSSLLKWFTTDYEQVVENLMEQVSQLTFELKEAELRAEEEKKRARSAERRELKYARCAQMAKHAKNQALSELKKTHAQLKSTKSMVHVERNSARECEIKRRFLACELENLRKQVPNKQVPNKQVPNKQVPNKQQQRRRRKQRNLRNPSKYDNY